MDLLYEEKANFFKRLSGWEKLSAVSVNLSNNLKCFPELFFSNKRIWVHSLASFFIHIDKRLGQGTILTKSVVVLAICRVSELIEA